MGRTLYHLTPYVDVVESDDGRARATCSRCGHDYCDAAENFKFYALVHDCDPKEVHPGSRGPDPEWMIYREFYCPGCGAQIEVEATPPCMPILHSTEVTFHPGETTQ